MACLIMEQLNAGDCMRLGMSCTRMMNLILERGVLFGPIHRSVPFITGLSPGRDSSYYLDILQVFFGPALSHRAEILSTTGYFWSSGCLGCFVYRNKYAFWTNAGRLQILSCLDILVSELTEAPLWNEVRRAEQMNGIDKIRRMVTNAFCVRARRLVPGLMKSIEIPVPDAQVDAYHFNHDGSESESSGSDSDEGGHR